MDFKNFLPTFLAAITAIFVAIIILKVTQMGKKKKWQQQMQPGMQQQAQPQMVTTGLPQSFSPTNSIPQLNMPVNFAAPTTQ